MQNFQRNQYILFVNFLSRKGNLQNPNKIKTWLGYFAYFLFKSSLLFETIQNTRMQKEAENVPVSR